MNPADKLLQETVKNKLDDMYKELRKTNHRYHRPGIHASGIIETDGTFCIREKVLKTLFSYNSSQYLPTRVIRRMKTGDYIHLKWQDMFEEIGAGITCEKQFMSNKWLLSGSPDAIIELMNKNWVIEIKSKKKESYETMTKLPIGVERQIQIYMYMTGISRGIVIFEAIDSKSSFRPYIVRSNYDLISKYVDRLYKISVLIVY